MLLILIASLLTVTRGINTFSARRFAPHRFSPARRVRPALRVDSLVRVVIISIDAAIVDDVLERVVHQSPAASIVAIVSGAVDQLLFAETVAVAC